MATEALQLWMIAVTLCLAPKYGTSKKRFPP